MQYILRELADGTSAPAFVLDSALILVHANEHAKQLPALCKEKNTLRNLLKNSGLLAGLQKPGESAYIPLPAEAKVEGTLLVNCVTGGYLCTLTAPPTANLQTFLENLTRQMRSSLSTIFSYLPLLGKNFAEQTGSPFYLNEITDACYLLLRTLNNTQLFTQLNSGMGRVGGPVDLGSLVEKICEASTVLCHELGIPLHVHAQKDLVVLIDESHFCHLLANLLLNAYTYTRAGNEIMVEALREGDEFVMRVQDRGAGIPAQEMINLFQLPTATSEHTGLSLAIGKNIVHNAGGTIVAESLFGTGTTITVRLPLTDAIPPALCSSAQDHLQNNFSTLQVQLSPLIKHEVL